MILPSGCQFEFVILAPVAMTHLEVWDIATVLVFADSIITTNRVNKPLWDIGSTDSLPSSQNGRRNYNF